MEEAGLTSQQTGMDNVRNIMTCPVAGLSPDEVLDATPLISALTEELVGHRSFSNLPRKFNMAVTGCPDNLFYIGNAAFRWFRRTRKGTGYGCWDSTSSA